MVRSGAVREEREAEGQQGWRAPWRVSRWLPTATGLRPGLRALSPGSRRLQGRPPTPLQMEKLRPGVGARGCTTYEVAVFGGGFTRPHNLILLPYSKIHPGLLGVFRTCNFLPHPRVAYSLVCFFSKLSDLFFFKYDFIFYREPLLLRI